MNLLNEKILIVDDTVENLNLLNDILKGNGYELFLSKDLFNCFMDRLTFPSITKEKTYCLRYGSCLLIKELDKSKNFKASIFF